MMRYFMVSDELLGVWFLNECYFLIHFRPLAAENEVAIPRFNTRRSLRQPNKWKFDPSNMPPVTIEDYLERKQQAQSGGKRATLRSWKTYYTVLSGQILCFFKDPNDFKESKAASPPILIHHAAVEKASDYTKKKNVIRLVTQDNSEFLFDAGSRERCELWTEKLLASAMSDPGESVKQSIMNQENSLHHHQQQHPTPTTASPPSKKSATLEPVYANLPLASGDPESDTISELDSKEKRSGGRLSKFLSRKHKPAN